MDKKSEESDQKRQKLEVDENMEDCPSSPSSASTYDSEDIEVFNEEYDRSGPYDFDFSKSGRFPGLMPFVFENSEYTDEPETDKDLMDQLCKMALKKYNDDKNTNFEFVRAVKANWHPATGVTFYITFEAKDVSHTEPMPIPFHAKVGYLPSDIRIAEVKPKP